MFETVCTYPLPSDLFCQAIHPSLPLVAVGLASGHVQALRLPSLTSSSTGNGTTSPISSSSGSSSNSASGCGTINKCWQTKRHKGSCRSLAFSVDGEQLVSAGSDGIVKIARTETGRVERKLAVPAERGSIPAAPSLVHVISPETVLVGTDTSSLHLYDFRAEGSSVKPQQTYHPHDDYVSSLTPLPATQASTSGFSKQWVTTGGTTVAVTDLRRGVLVKSEDQEEELLSSVFVSGLSKRGSSTGEKVLVGGAGGVITLWEKGVWDDQDERIIVDAGRGGGESLDSMAVVPDGMGHGKEVVVGLGNGSLRVVRLGMNKVVKEYSHDEIEAVLGLGFEPEGRMVSGGGQILKVWQESSDVTGEASDDDDDDEEEEDVEAGAAGFKKRAFNAGSDSSDAEGSDDSDGDKGDKKKRKKRKKGKGRRMNGTAGAGGGGKQTTAAFKGLD